MIKGRNDTKVIRLDNVAGTTNFHVIEGPITRDKIACYSFHSFLVEVHINLADLAIYMLRMRNRTLRLGLLLWSPVITINAPMRCYDYYDFDYYYYYYYY